MKSSQSRQSIISWAFYDWANSAFSLSVVTAFVPVLLAQYWNDGAASTVTTFRLGWANSLASLLVALLAPVVGAIADRAGRRKGLNACSHEDNDGSHDQHDAEGVFQQVAVVFSVIEEHVKKGAGN